MIRDGCALSRKRACFFSLSRFNYLLRLSFILFVSFSTREKETSIVWMHSVGRNKIMHRARIANDEVEETQRTTYLGAIAYRYVFSFFFYKAANATVY